MSKARVSGRLRRTAVVGPPLLVALATAVLLVAGCSSDNKSAGGTTSTTGSPTTQGQGNQGFCQAARQAAGTGFSTDPAQRSQVVDAIHRLDATAPSAIRSAADTVNSVFPQLLAIYDQMRAAGGSRDMSQMMSLSQQAQQLSNQLGTATQQLTTYVSQNCPGVSVPTVPVNPPTSS